MPLIQHVYPWDSQPQEAVGANPDAFRIAPTFLHLFPRSVDLSGNGFNLAFGSATAIAPTQDGICLATSDPGGNSLGAAGFTRDWEIAANAPFTTFCRFSTTDNEGGLLAPRSPFNNGNPILGLYIGFNGITSASGTFVPLVRGDVGGFVETATGVSVSDGRVHTCAIRRLDNEMAWSVDGSAWSNFGQITGAFTFAATHTGYGHEYTNGIIGSLAANFSIGGHVPYGMTNEEIWSLHNDPWQLFAPRVQYIPTASGAPVPTLGIPTFVPGSLTSSGFRPRFPVTWA